MWIQSTLLALLALAPATSASYYGHSFYGVAESSSMYGAAVAGEADSHQASESSSSEAAQKSSRISKSASARVRAVQAHVVQRQVAFKLEIEGLNLQRLIGKETEYEEFSYILNDVLKSCTQDSGDSKAMLGIWYHTLRSAKGSSAVEVEGHLDFGDNVKAATDLAKELRKGKISSKNLPDSCRESVMGSEMRFVVVDVVAFPPALTAGIQPGKLPDRKTLLLEQLADFKTAMNAGSKIASSKCEGGCCNLQAWVVVGDPEAPCFGRGTCDAGECQCDKGYSRKDCGECATGFVPVKNSCRHSASLWGAELTEALAQGNFWVLDNSGGSQVKRDTSSRTAALPPTHVPRAAGAATAPSNITTARNLTVHTNGTKWILTPVDGNPGDDDEEGDVGTRVVNSDDMHPRRAPEASGYSPQLSGTEGISVEVGHYAMPRKAFPQHTPSPTDQAEEHEPGVTLLEHTTPAPLPAAPTTSGRIEFLSPAASGLFANSAKQLSSPSYFPARDAATTGSKRAVQASTKSMEMTGEESHPGERDVLGIQLPSMGMLIAIACGSVTLIAMVSCSVSYGMYLRRERRRDDDESTDSDSDGTDYDEQSEEDQADDGNVLGKDDDGDTCMDDDCPRDYCRREEQRNPVRTPAVLSCS